MGLKELTADKHTEAENTLFMKAIFSRTLDPALYTKFLFQKYYIYKALEKQAARRKLFIDNSDFQIHDRLIIDYRKRLGSNIPKDTLGSVTGDYVQYIDLTLGAQESADGLLAHIYTWHMGDLYGGQAIKALLPGSNLSLEFDNPDKLKAEIRALLNDNMAEEANKAFDYAIKMLKVYDRDLEQNS